jgi:hypothetical protein
MTMRRRLRGLRWKTLTRLGYEPSLSYHISNVYCTQDHGGEDDEEESEEEEEDDAALATEKAYVPVGTTVRGTGRASRCPSHADRARVGSPINSTRASTPIPASTSLRTRASSTESTLEDDQRPGKPRSRTGPSVAPCVVLPLFMRRDGAGAVQI